MKIYTKKYLNELREKINIVEIISLWVPLRKSGDVYKACCPFHDEPTPSFTVHTKTNHYHCLGCGAHGDSVAFLMNYLQCGFKEAIRCIEVFYKKKERKECMGEDVNLTEVRDQIDKLTKLVMSLSEHKTKVRVAGYVEKRKERKSELEQELLLRCATVMDKIKDRDDNFICTYSDVVNIYKLMGSEKIRFISMNSDKLNCSHCFIRNKSHLSVYLKRFIMWLMDNSSKYNLVLKGSSIYI